MNTQPKFVTHLLAFAAFAPLVAVAQAHGPGHGTSHGMAAKPMAAVSAAAPAAASAATEMAEAEVRKIDKDAKKMTLKHGPIKSLDMPAMTMVFQIRDAALLDKAKVGDKILFSAEQREGAYVVIAIEPAGKR